MNHARTHALILGASFLVSVAIIAGRMSLGGRAASSNAAGPKVVKEVERQEDEVEEEDPVDRVTRYLGVAENLLKESAAVEGRGGEVQQALKILGEAQVLLETLSKDDARVNNLRIRCGQLRQDASRVSEL